MSRDNSNKVSVYLCKHKRTDAIIFTAVALQKDFNYQTNRVDIDSKTIKNRIRQLLNRKVTARSPEIKKEIHQFIQDKRLNVEVYQIPFEWDMELLETIDKSQYYTRVSDLINNLKHNGYTVLSTAERTPSPR